MKIRSGFVSNSSSSSFIMVLDSDKKPDCEICNQLLSEFFEYTGKARKYIEDEYCYKNYQDWLDSYSKSDSFLLLDAVKEDKIIYVREIEYGEEGLANIIEKIATKLGAEVEWDG